MDKRSGAAGDSQVINSSKSSNILDCDDILCEILSRLPVKSLMLCKCVSKHWQFLICKDQGLVDLHFTRSKQRCSDQFIVVPVQAKTRSWNKYKKSFLLTNLFESRPFRTTVRKLKQKPIFYTQILTPVNGLICFVDHHIASVRILNPCTRELTPWIASASLRQSKKYNIIAKNDLRLWLPTYFFGFDPATKQHKVIYTYTVREAADFSKNVTIGDDILKRTHICEVLTVGENTWRSIDAKVPFSYDVQYSVYSNGFIYWGDTSVGIPKYLNAFDVGREKFQVIKVHEEIRNKCENPPGGECGPYHSLIEVRGHIALLQRWTEKVVKLWICEDDHNSTGGYTKWTELTMELPFGWGGVNGGFPYFHSVAGEDRIIIESYPTMNESGIKNASLYSYDCKKKITTKMVKRGVVSDLVSVSLFSKLEDVSLFMSFTESLWPVRHQWIKHNQQ
ncbi:hypothetical protein MKW92_047306, partial [Papaver armeniacum]